MADDVRVTNWPSDGSRERVAFDLYQRIAHGAKLPPKSGVEHVKQQLQLYEACLSTVARAPIDVSKIT